MSSSDLDLVSRWAGAISLIGSSQNKMRSPFLALRIRLFFLFCTLVRYLAHIFFGIGMESCLGAISSGESFDLDSRLLRALHSFVSFIRVCKILSILILVANGL